MSVYYITACEPRRTYEFASFTEALHFAMRREIHGDTPVRMLEEIDWKDCLAPEDLERLARA